MIAYFPTPLPDELWYSVVMRYHIHSGQPHWKDTAATLHIGRNITQTGWLFPNQSMRWVAHELPHLLSLQELTLNHTLFPFWTLFLPPERRAGMLADYLTGADLQPHFIKNVRRIKGQALRYCPLCCQEDAETYGEAYWHTEHQIGLMQLCPKHRCRLASASMPLSTPISRQALMLDSENLDAVDYTSTPAEIALTQMLHQLYSLPFSPTRKPNPDNLLRAIENAGLMSWLQVKHRAIDTDALSKQLLALLGPECINSIFDGGITPRQGMRIRAGEARSTEQYACLMVLLGLAPDDMFSPTLIPLVIEERLKQMASSGIPYSKAHVAAQAGVPESMLVSFARRFNVPLFWLRAEKKKRQCLNIQMWLTDEELAKVNALKDALGIERYSYLSLYCIMREAERSESPSKSEKT